MPRNLAGHDPLHENLHWLKPVLLQWIQINREYADAYAGDDALYWYNERANIGSLAGAAWKANIYAVEEYTAFKRPASVTSKGSGRIDLYLADDHRDAIVEAKLCWVAPRTSPQTLRKAMANALKDARRDRDGEQKIGVVFYVMRVHENRAEETALREEVERVRQINPDGLAWCFPATARPLKSDKPEHIGFVWPGVIMALKLARLLRRAPSGRALGA
jgi:hypothetical protein